MRSTSIQQLSMKLPGFVIERFVQSKMKKVRQMVAECQTLIDDSRHAEWNATHNVVLQQAVNRGPAAARQQGVGRWQWVRQAVRKAMAISEDRE